MDDTRAGFVLPPSLMQVLGNRQQLMRLGIALVVALALVGIGYFWGYRAAPSTAGVPTPPHIALPPHATLTRTEAFVSDGITNWYYTVPAASIDSLAAFYVAQLPGTGWQCVTITKSSSFTFYGQQFSGDGAYLTALRDGQKAQIYTGTTDYGAFLIEDDVPNGAVALKVSLEAATAKNSVCSAG